MTSVESRSLCSNGPSQYVKAGCTYSNYWDFKRLNMILVREKYVYVDIFGKAVVSVWTTKKKKKQNNRLIKYPPAFDYKNLQILVLVQLLTMPASNLWTPVFSTRISWIRLSEYLWKLLYGQVLKLIYINVYTT
jgi:hypothetical protein